MNNSSDASSDSVNMRNIRLFSGPLNKDGSFSIYISFSGSRVDYLYTQRKSIIIHKALRTGATLNELKRMYYHNNSNQRSNETKNSIRHIISVAESYIMYEYAA